MQVIRFGNYEVINDANGEPCKLGGGAFGKTYKAHHKYLNQKEVALKVLHDRHADDSNIRERFLREAKAAHLLKHPHIAEVLDFGEESGSLYYAMEFCSGGNLDLYIKKLGAIKPSMALEFIRQIADALACAHEHGLVHRDLKPANIMLAKWEDNPTLKIIDFGLVKQTGNDQPGITLSGEVLGTPMFASPEQLRDQDDGGGDVDHRSDIFSLGMTLWYLLQGAPPIPGSAASIIAERVGPSKYTRLFSDRVPVALRGFLSRMLEKDPAQRFQSAREILTALDELKQTMQLEDPADGDGQESVVLFNRDAINFLRGAGSSRGALRDEQHESSVGRGGPSDSEVTIPLPRASHASQSGLRSVSLSASLKPAQPPDNQPRFRIEASLGRTVLGESHLAHDDQNGQEVIAVHLSPDCLAPETWAARLSSPTATASAEPLNLVAQEASGSQLAIGANPAVIPLVQLLETRKALTFLESSRILSQAAEILDAPDVIAAGQDVDLGRIALLSLNATPGNVMNPSSIDKWPPFFVCVPLIDAVPAPAAAPDQPATDTSRSPSSKIAELCSFLMTGKMPDPAAFGSEEHYVQISALSRATNKTLSGCLAGKRAKSKCKTILEECIRTERNNVAAPATGGYMDPAQASSPVASQASAPPQIPAASPAAAAAAPAHAPMMPPPPAAPELPKSPISARDPENVAREAGISNVKTGGKSKMPIIVAALLTLVVLAWAAKTLLFPSGPPHPTELVLDVFPEAALVQVNGSTVTPSKKPTREMAVSLKGAKPPITVVISAPDGYTGDPVTIVDPTTPFYPKSITFIPKIIDELQFAGGLNPPDSPVLINGKPATLRTDAQGKTVIDLKGVTEPREIKISPPPGYAGDPVVITNPLTPTYDKLVSFSKSAPEALAELVLAGGLEPANALITVNGKPGTTSVKSDGKISINLSGVAKPIAIKISPPQGYMGEPVIISNVSGPSYADKIAFAAVPPPPTTVSWTGAFECKFEFKVSNRKGGFDEGQTVRVLNIVPGLTGSTATDTIYFKGSKDGFPSEPVVLKDIKVSEEGALRATISTADPSNPDNYDESINLVSTGPGTFKYEFMPAAGAKQAADASLKKTGTASKRPS